MSIVAGHLTPSQEKIWNLRRKGLSQTNIALRLGVSRQAVHKILEKADSRVLRALIDTARINKLDIRTIDPAKGILLGFSPGFRSKVFIAYSQKNGLQMWYEHKGQCEGCRRREECARMLLDTAKEWEVELTNEELKLSPTLLAERLFSEVTGIE